MPAKASGNTYFAYVDCPGQPPLRQPILAVQERKRMVGDESIPERSRLFIPDGNGVITVDEQDQDYKKVLAAIKRKMDGSNIDGQPKKMVGPFFDTDDGISGYMHARAEAEKERPKTTEEQVAIVRAENATLRTQIEKLKGKKSAKIEEIFAKTGEKK